MGHFRTPRLLPLKSVIAPLEQLLAIDAQAELVEFGMAVPNICRQEDPCQNQLIPVAMVSLPLIRFEAVQCSFLRAQRMELKHSSVFVSDLALVSLALVSMGSVTKRQLFRKMDQ